MSNAVKRMFPEPSFRPSDYPGEKVLDVTVTLEPEKISAVARVGSGAGAEEISASVKGTFAPAKDPSRTRDAVEKAMAKLGGTDYRLGQLTVNDPKGLFAPASLLNDLRRDLVARAEEARAAARAARIDAALADDVDAKSVRVPVDAKSVRVPVDAKSVRVPVDAKSVRVGNGYEESSFDAERIPRLQGDAERIPRLQGDAERIPRLRGDAERIPRLRGDAERIPRLRSLRIRVGQSVPAGDWDEIVVAISSDTQPSDLLSRPEIRLALPVYTKEPDFNALRTCVKRFLRAGYAKWEASDLATVRMLRALGVTDLTADWTLYAFNSQALKALAELGVMRFVASPENGADNLAFLNESGYPVACLVQQSTPLFISLTEPASRACGDLRIFLRDGLWITTKRVPRTFAAPKGAATRVDLSWDPPAEGEDSP